MPKSARTSREVEIIREKILDTALDLILTNGFASLSIRKIATKLGVSATTIYLYYKNRDELNLMIRVRGFQTLYHMMHRTFKDTDEIGLQVSSMVKGFIDFGINYPGYYELMFTLNTPKFLDYVGTRIESVATFEKDTALKCYYALEKVLKSNLDMDEIGHESGVMYIIMRVWSDLHGMISLVNSRLFLEVTDSLDEFVEKRTKEIIDYILKLKNQ